MTTTSRPKRILLVRNAMSYDFGGAERFVVFLAEQLQQYGWEPIIITKHRKIRAFAKDRGVRAYRGWWWSAQNWSGARILLTPAYLVWQLVLTIWYLQLVLRLRPDVVHPQSKDDFLAATFAARLAGKPVVWTDHADLKYIYQNVAVPFKNPVGKLVRFASRFASAITLVSDSERRLVQAALGRPLPKKYTVVHNGMLDQTYRPVRRRPADRDAVIFCATSRLVTAKGIGELIQAFSLLAKGSDSYRLWLVGEGPEGEHFRETAADNPHIVFVGHSDTPMEYLTASDIFVHPSYHEGFSLSVVEAAMAGKPIIACDVGGNPEIVTHESNGLLVPDRDVQALATAMRRLADNADLRKKYGSAARRTYKEHFRFDAIVQLQFVPLYERLAKRHTTA